MTLYQTLVQRGVKIDNHESDLYCEDTPETRKLVKSFGKVIEPFQRQPDGTMWLDVAFSYDPFWINKP